MNLQGLLKKVKDIILSPGESLPRLAEEKETIQDLFKNYLAPLAAIPAVAHFVGIAFVGYRMPLAMSVRYRLPLFEGLLRGVLFYVMFLAGILLLGLVVENIAPPFGGEKDRLAAVRLVGYTATPALIGGVFYAIPGLGLFILLAVIYSFFLFYQGVSLFVKVPREKTLTFTVAIVAIYIFLAIVFGIVIGSAVPGRRIGAGMI